MLKKSIFLLLLLGLQHLTYAQKTELVVQNGHSGGPNSIALSIDQQILCTSSGDGSVVFWEAKSGLQLVKHQLTNGQGATSVNFSKDGKYVVVTSEGFIALFNAKTTNLIKTIPVENFNSAAAFTPDSKYLISCGWSGKVTVWATGDWKQAASFNPFEEVYKYNAYLSTLTISPDGKEFVVGSKSAGIASFTIPTIAENWTAILTTRKFKETLTSKLAYVKNGNYLAVLTDNNQFQILDPKSLALIAKKETNVTDFFSKLKGDKLYIKEDYTNLTQVQIPSLAIVKPIPNPDYSIFFPQENSDLIYETKNGSSTVFEKNENSLKPTGKQFKSQIIKNSYISISPNGKLLALNSTKFVTIYNLEEAKVIKRIKHIDAITSDSRGIEFDKTSKYLYVNEAQSISQWNTSDWSLKQVFKNTREDLISAFKVSKDGKYLAIVDDKNDKSKLTVYSTSTAQLLGVKTFKNGLSSCDFASDSKTLIVSGGTQPLTGFSMPNLNLLFTGTEQTVGEKAIFSPDDTSIFTFDRNAIYKTTVSNLSTQFLYSEGQASKFGFPVYDVKFAPNGESFILSGNRNFSFRSNTETANPIVKMSEQGSPVLSIAYADNGKFYATAGYDGQVIIRNNKDEVLVKLFTFNDLTDWVAIAPDGRFDAPISAQNHLYFHRNEEILPLSSLFEYFYTPRLLQRLFAGENFGPVAIDINNIKARPTVKISYAALQRNLNVTEDLPSYNNTTGIAEITVNATSLDDTIDEIRLFHNGKTVTLTTRNLIVVENNGTNSSKKYQLNLGLGKNSIRAVALNSQRTESKPDEINVFFTANKPNSNPIINNNQVNLASIDKTATLHLVVIGINAYQNPSMSLNYALADATAFKNEIERDSKSIINNIKTYFVKDDQANKKGITDALALVKQNAKAQDVFIFYYAGHGVISSNNEFYIVPNDITDLKNVQAELVQKGISAKLLQEFAVDIQAQKQLFILDACQSAGAFEKLLKADANQQKSIAMVAKSTGTHWMAASGSQQFANEFAALGHGAFTYVLLQALKGQAANNKMITVNGLKNFMQLQVPALMKKYSGTSQMPASYGFGNDFPVQITP